MNRSAKAGIIGVVVAVFLLPIFIVLMPKIFSMLGAQENDYLLFKTLIALFFGGVVWMARSLSAKKSSKEERKPLDED